MSRSAANCVIEGAIIDEHCEIPNDMKIGVDREADAKRFHVTEKGVVLVTPDMLRGLQATAMTSQTRLPVVLLWHMHQPQYRDALTGEYVLPWTYLHAIKDYTDMAAHLESIPAARAVVNFTPVLIEQLEEIAQRTNAHLQTGAPLPDPVLALLGPDPVPRDPGRAPRSDEGVSARPAQADDRAVRAVSRAGHDRGDAGDARAHRLRLQSTHSRSRRLVSPGLAR